MRSYGIIGYPLDHSFSQQYFTEKFRSLGLDDHQYLNFPISRIEELPAIIAGQSHLMGLNITIPYKKQVVPFLTDRSNIPAGMNACNCISIENGKTIGYNTDIIGFERSLKSAWKNKDIKALLLGSGGAAEAVCFVLKSLAIDYVIVGREKSYENKLTYADLDEQLIKTHLLIINTTPVGTYPDINDCPRLPYSYLTTNHLLYDLVYNPAKTMFLQKGEERGAAIQNGYEMLVLQAEESWRIWTSERSK